VLLTRRDFRLLPKAKIDALIASTEKPSTLFGRRTSPRAGTGDAAASPLVVPFEEGPSSACFDLTHGPRLQPRPPPGSNVPKPPTKHDQILCGSYTVGGSFVPRQQGITHSDVASAASSHMLQEMSLHEQLLRLRSVTTGRYDLFDGGHDTMQALLDSLQAIYSAIPPQQATLRDLAGAAFRSVAAGLFFDVQASASPRHSTAPAGSSKSGSRLSDYASITAAQRCNLPRTVVSHKAHAVEVENQLAWERDRLLEMRVKFEELQLTLRRYEAQAKKDHSSTDPQIEPAAGRQHAPTPAHPHHGDQLEGRMQLMLDEVQRLREALADRDDVISRQTSEIMYLQGKCNELQRLLSHHMETTLDFAVKYKQTLEKTTGHASPMLLDGRTAEQVAWQSNMDIARIFGMPVQGIPSSTESTTADCITSSAQRLITAQPQQQPGKSGSVVYVDHLTPAERLQIMQHTTLPTTPTHAVASAN
jgi:hypothetical protein